MDYITTHTSLSPIWRGFVPGFVNYKKGCTRLAAASDKVYQLLAHGRWFSPGTPSSSTTKTGRHDIAESGIQHNKSNQCIPLYKTSHSFLQNYCQLSNFSTLLHSFNSCVFIDYYLLSNPQLTCRNWFYFE